MTFPCWQPQLPCSTACGVSSCLWAWGYWRTTIPQIAPQVGSHSCCPHLLCQRMHHSKQVEPQMASGAHVLMNIRLACQA